MSPARIWEFGRSDHTVWLRFANEPILITTLGVMTGLIVLGMNLLDPELKQLVVWKRDVSWMKSVAAGIFGAAIVALPSYLLQYGAPIEQRGGAVPGIMIAPLLCISIVGNFYEEILFRGYLQGYFEKVLGPRLAATLSALFFSAGHIFLASTVTNIGAAILIFTVYEGSIAAFLRMRFGLISAILAHGLGIFMLASGAS